MEWLSQNYIYFVLGYEVIALILLIIGICRKKVKIVDTGLAGVLSSLPDYINDAELTGLDGSKKFALVFSKAVHSLVASSTLDSNEVITKYGTLLSCAIENILKTPTKKGESYEKKIINEDK